MAGRWERWRERKTEDDNVLARTKLTKVNPVNISSFQWRTHTKQHFQCLTEVFLRMTEIIFNAQYNYLIKRDNSRAYNQTGKNVTVSLHCQSQCRYSFPAVQHCFFTLFGFDLQAFVNTFSNLPGVKKYLNSPRRFPPPDKEYAKDALAILY